MLDVIEAPAGHLSGSMVISSIGKNGQRLGDITRSVSGDLYKNNISLKIGEDSIFSNSINAVGIAGYRKINLEIGGAQVVLVRMSRREYEKSLNQLNGQGRVIQMALSARKSTEEYQKYLDSLNANLQDFIRWGNDRVANVSSLNEWYIIRLKQYRRCFDFVALQSKRNIPSWKWQSCVLDMDSDEYERKQTIDSVTRNNDIYNEKTKSLNSEIEKNDQQKSEIVYEWQQLCAVSRQNSECNKNLSAFRNSQLPDQIIRNIDSYKALLPRLQLAIKQDVDTAAAGDSELSKISLDADNLLKESN